MKTQTKRTPEGGGTFRRQAQRLPWEEVRKALQGIDPKWSWVRLPSFKADRNEAGRRNGSAGSALNIQRKVDTGVTFSGKHACQCTGRPSYSHRECRKGLFSLLKKVCQVAHAGIIAK